MTSSLNRDLLFRFLNKLNELNIMDSKDQEKKEKINYDSITLDTFKGVKYTDLLDKFKELGVESAWKPGTKAKVMIKNALDKIAVIRDLEKKGIEIEEAKETAEKIIEVKQVLKEADEVVEEKKKVDLDAKNREQEKEDILSKKYNKEQLESVLANINLNIKDSVPSHRAILLRKLEIVNEIISEIE